MDIVAFRLFVVCLSRGPVGRDFRDELGPFGFVFAPSFGDGGLWIYARLLGPWDIMYRCIHIHQDEYRQKHSNAK